MATSRVRQNYHEECEAAVNKQINLELYSGYVYQSMHHYFCRDDIALPGFASFFKNSAAEEQHHAQKLMEYQNKRGGRIVLQDIKKPFKDEWGTGLDAMRDALELERQVNESLLKLHGLAEKHFDAHLDDWVEEEFLNEQVDAIKMLSDYITKLERCGPGIGEYLFDKEELQEQSGSAHGAMSKAS